MSAVALSLSVLPRTRAWMWRRQFTVLLIVLGLVLPFGVAITMWKGHLLSTDPSLYSVKGKVLVNGKLVENVNVAFHPLDGNRNLFCPVGRTNNKGIFRLTTHSSSDGAPAGEYRVTFVWPDGAIDECECLDPSLHDRFKGIYSKAEQSTFQVGVNHSGNLFWFNLQQSDIEGSLP